MTKMVSEIYISKLGKFHLVLDRNSQILLPYSHWLNQLSSDQVSTFAKRVDTIRRLSRFFQISGIDLVQNIIHHNRLMSLSDGRSVRNLCFLKQKKLKAGDQYIQKAYLNLPIHEIENRRNLIVTRNTASITAHYIGQFLEFFVAEFAESLLENRESCELLRENTEKLIEVVTDIRISSTKHSNEIRSYPLKRFSEIIAAIVNTPEQVFVTKNNRVSQTLKRDQLLTLLAAEGLRRGEIGNLMLKDLIKRDGRMYLRIKSNLDGRDRITTNTSRAKNKAAGRGVLDHHLLLQQTTQLVCENYIESERRQTIMRFGVNAVKSITGDSWLFANSRGASALKTTSLVDEAFLRAAIGLQKLGLLDRADYDPYVLEQKKYGCTAHWFRHSSACAFVHTFYLTEGNLVNSEKLFSLMRLRFGWARTSEMPMRYAERALHDETNKLVERLNDSILSVVKVAENEE